MKGRNRNDLCWCGSGRKFKRCHLGREAEEPVEASALVAEFKKAFGDKTCLHPEASSEVCDGLAIHSHSIQRSGGLAKLAHEGHVFGFKLGLGASEHPERIGIGRASTFTGFCRKHDPMLFAPLEREPFSITNEKMLLLGYRAIAREFFAKRGAAKLIPSLLQGDRGHPSPYQRLYQYLYGGYGEGVNRGLEVVDSTKKEYDGLLSTGALDAVRYYAIEFASVPEVACSAAIFAEIDFDGNLLQELTEDSEPRLLSFTITPTDSGGAVVFSWLGEDEHVLQLVRSFARIGDDRIASASITFAFEFAENTYFSEEWWTLLDKGDRDALKQRFHYTADPSNPRIATALLDEGRDLATWPSLQRVTNVEL